MFHGSQIAKWRKANYQEKEDFANFKDLLEAPALDAAFIIEERFPQPLYVECDEGGSQARYLTAIVDPEQSQGFGSPQNTFNINTEDASLQRFMDHLKKFVAQQS